MPNRLKIARKWLKRIERSNNYTEVILFRDDVVRWTEGSINLKKPLEGGIKNHQPSTNSTEASRRTYQQHGRNYIRRLDWKDQSTRPTEGSNWREYFPMNHRKKLLRILLEELQTEVPGACRKMYQLYGINNRRYNFLDWIKYQLVLRKEPPEEGIKN